MDEASEDREFAELLESIGASAEPSGPAAELFLKDQELAELRQCLAALRPIGDRLAELEQRRLAERAELEGELAALRPLTAQLEHAREEGSRWRARAEELAQARGAAPGGPGPAGLARTVARLERELARRDGLLQRERERLARVRERLAAREQRAREYRLLAQERGVELRGLRALLRRHERELRHIGAEIPRAAPAAAGPKRRKRSGEA